MARVSKCGAEDLAIVQNFIEDKTSPDEAGRAKLWMLAEVGEADG